MSDRRIRIGIDVGGTFTDLIMYHVNQKTIFEEREKKYLAVADFICDTSNCRPAETVQEIAEFLKTKGWI